MHTLLIFLMSVLILSAVFVIICHVNDENLTPVGKTFSSLFIGCCAVVLSIQVLLDHPAPVELSSVQPVASAVFVPAAAGQAVVTSRPAVNQVAPGAAQVAAPGAVVVSSAQPERDSSVKDMLLGGALGYALGSSGRGNDTHTVTNHTTVVQSAPAAPSAPYRPAVATVSRPVAAAAPSRPTFKSTFSMTRSGRR